MIVNTVGVVAGIGGIVVHVLALLSLLLIPVGIVLVIAGLIRYFWPREDDPRTILQRRYAAGDISKSEYEELLQDLEGHS